MKKLLNMALIGALMLSSVGQVSASEGDTVQRTLFQRIPGFERVSKYMEENPRAAVFLIGAAITALGAYAAERTGNYVSQGWNWFTGKTTEIPETTEEQDSKKVQFQNELDSLTDRFKESDSVTDLKALSQEVTIFNGKVYGQDFFDLYQEGGELKEKIAEKIKGWELDKAATEEFVDTQLKHIESSIGNLVEDDPEYQEKLNNLSTQVQQVQKLIQEENLSEDFINRANILSKKIKDLLNAIPGYVERAKEMVAPVVEEVWQQVPTRERVTELTGQAVEGVVAAGQGAWKYASDYVWLQDPIPYDTSENFVEIQYLDKALEYFIQPDTVVQVTRNFFPPQLFKTTSSRNIIVEPGESITTATEVVLNIYDFTELSLDNSDYDLLIWASPEENASDRAIEFAKKYVQTYKVNVKLVGLSGRFLTEPSGRKNEYEFYSNQIGLGKDNEGQDRVGLNNILEYINNANAIHTFGATTQGAWVKNLLDLHLINYENGILIDKLHGMQWGVSIADAGYQKFLEYAGFDNGLPPEFVKKQLNIYGNNVGDTSGVAGRTYKDSEPAISNLTNVKLKIDGYDTNLENIQEFLFDRYGYFKIRSLTDAGSIYYNNDPEQTYNLTIGYHTYDELNSETMYFYPTITASDPEVQSFINQVDDITFQQLASEFKNAKQIEDEYRKQSELERLSAYQVELFKLFNYRMGQQYQEQFTYQQETTGLYGWASKAFSGVKGLLQKYSGYYLLPLNITLKWEE